MKNSQGLAVVQNLYLLQIDLQKYLRSDLSDPAARREAQERMKEFSSLLKQADWRYMGGEDVLTSLHNMEQEIRQKIVASPKKIVRHNAPRASAPVRKAAKVVKSRKVVTKKKAAKPVKKIVRKASRRK
jgi:hypothetical protein